MSSYLLCSNVTTLIFKPAPSLWLTVCEQRKYELHAVNARSNLKKNWNEPLITSSTVKAMSRFADIS